MDARSAVEMEQLQRGKTFTVMDPANYPEKETAPNRGLIIFIGLIAALGISIIFATIADFTDTAINTVDELLAAVPAPVLGLIPVIETRGDVKMRRVRKAIQYMLLVATGVAIAVYFIMVF